MEAEEADNADSTPPLEENSALSQFVENMGLHYEHYGVPRIGGRMLGLLLVAPGPISSEAMAEALQVSRSSISTNLRMLLLSGLVEKVSLPGERCDYYVFAASAWQRAFEMRLAGVLPLRSLAEQGLQGLEEGHPARPRLQEMLEWAGLVEKFYTRLREEWQSKREVPA